MIPVHHAIILIKGRKIDLTTPTLAASIAPGHEAMRP